VTPRIGTTPDYKSQPRHVVDLAGRAVCAPRVSETTVTGGGADALPLDVVHCPQSQSIEVAEVGEGGFGLATACSSRCSRPYGKRHESLVDGVNNSRRFRRSARVVSRAFA
jgi:hypothetical protein